MAQRQFRSDDTSTWLERYGNLSDGAYSPSTSTDSPIDSTATGTVSTNSLSATNASFASGQVILIHQTRGTGVGNWELNVIDSYSTGVITTKYTLTNTYNSGAQVLVLNQYSSATIGGGVTLTAKAWDGSTGGIIGWLCDGTTTITGTISGNAKGYRGSSVGGGPAPTPGYAGEGTIGAATPQIGANGNGGGGGLHNTGGYGAGAGGGHASSGGNGTAQGNATGGTGGATSGNSSLTSMTFGGAGGQASDYTTGRGPGGNGGAIVLIISRNITVTGSIAVNGGDGVAVAFQTGSGGGAGGSILLKGHNITLGSNLVTAAKGLGMTNYAPIPAGDGSVGRIHIDYANTPSGTTSPTYDGTQDEYLADVEQQSSVKASIIVHNSQDSSVIGNVLKTGTTDNNSAKAALILNRGIQYNAVLGSIYSGEFKKKRYGYKLYYSSTDIRDVWGNEVVSEPSFRTSINSGPGELVVRLARRFDEFGEGDDLVLNRKIDVYVYDRDEPQGALLYQGFLSSYSPVLEGTKEYVEVVILGYSVEIGQRILKDGAGNTTLDYTSEDPSDIMKDVIDKYIADGGSLTYDATTIDDTSTTVSYRFANYTVKEALDKIIELTPYDWYWRIDPDGKIYLKQQSEDADHKIYIGKHVTYMKPERSIEDVRNVVYFVGGTPEGEAQLYRKYTRTASVSAWGTREIVLSDSRVTLTDTADTKAGRFLDAHESPDVRTVLRILDNNGQNSGIGYDIESIHPGDTISIENLKTSQKQTTLWGQAQWDNSNWDFEIDSISSDVLHVINVTYNPFLIEVEAARALPVVAKRIEDIDRNVNDLQTTDLPVAPTDA